MKNLLLAAALSILPSLCQAGLQWEKTRLEFSPAVSDTEVKGEFNFSNTGTAPVTIESVAPECDCTTSVLDKKTYSPGEKGRITATFTMGQRTGLQDKAIKVTIQGEKEPTILSMVTHIPELIKITPSFVFWHTGDAPQPKSIDLTVAPGTAMRVTKVTSGDAKMTAKLETVEEGRAYRVVVTPGQTTTLAAAILWIECVSGSNVHRTLTAYAHIRR